MSYIPQEPRRSDLPSSIASACTLGVLLVLLAISFLAYSSTDSSASSFPAAVVISAR